MMATYTTPDLLQELNDYGALIVVILAVGGALLGWIRYEIRGATKQIQPNTNGGKSLSDAHKRIEEVDAKVDRVDSKVDRLDGKVDFVINLLTGERDERASQG